MHVLKHCGSCSHGPAAAARDGITACQRQPLPHSTTAQAAHSPHEPLHNAQLRLRSSIRGGRRGRASGESRGTQCWGKPVRRKLTQFSLPHSPLLEGSHRSIAANRVASSPHSAHTHDASVQLLQAHPLAHRPRLACNVGGRVLLPLLVQVETAATARQPHAPLVSPSTLGAVIAALRLKAV